MLLVRHGRADLVRSAGIDSLLEEEPSDGTTDAAERLAADLEAMGPTFIKLGQLMSSRVDLLTPAYIDALSRLQDDVAPFPIEEVEEIICSELQVRLSSVFPPPGSPSTAGRYARTDGTEAPARTPPAGEVSPSRRRGSP